MRLSKVAKELNVGTANIVDHLASNGIKIDARPNTKITPDAYQLLKQEFNADVEQHKLSAEVSQARREEKEAIKAVAIKKSEYIIKAKAPISGTKIVGKIDVNPPVKVSAEVKKVESKNVKDLPKKNNEQGFSENIVTPIVAGLAETKKTESLPDTNITSKAIFKEKSELDFNAYLKIFAFVF